MWQEYERLIGGAAERSEYARIINLSKNEEQILDGMTRGHRTAIKQAQKLGVEVVLNPDFNLFLASHLITEGRKNRNPQCWHILREFIERGEAFLMGARYQGKWIAFGYFFMYGDWSYYGLANIKEKYRHLKPSHLIQWEAMKHMKKNSIVQYEIGDQYPNGAPSEKEELIAKFKRGFGGETKMVVEIGNKYD